MRRRCVAASRPGAGASSTSFWWRRWVEQSRSPEGHDGAVGVTQQLHLDVAAALDVVLQVDAGRSPNACERLARGRGHGRRQVGRIVDAAHAAAAAAGRGLDQHRVPDRPRPSARSAPRRRVHRPRWARRCRARWARRWRGADRRAASLSPRPASVAGVGPDEHDARRPPPLPRTAPAPTGSRSPGWMASAPGRERGRDDRRRPEVALGRRARARCGRAWSAARTCSASASASL